jgi:hypothetical protein
MVKAAITALGRLVIVLIAGVVGSVAVIDLFGTPLPIVAAALRGAVAGLIGRQHREAIGLAAAVEASLFGLAWWTGAPGSLGQGAAILATGAGAAAVFSLTKGRTGVKSGAPQAQVFPEPANDPTVHEDEDED